MYEELLNSSLKPIPRQIRTKSLVCAAAAAAAALNDPQKPKTQDITCVRYWPGLRRKELLILGSGRFSHTRSTAYIRLN